MADFCLRLFPSRGAGADDILTGSGSESTSFSTSIPRKSWAALLVFSERTESGRDTLRARCCNVCKSYCYSLLSKVDEVQHSHDLPELHPTESDVYRLLLVLMLTEQFGEKGADC